MKLYLFHFLGIPKQVLVDRNHLSSLDIIGRIVRDAEIIDRLQCQRKDGVKKQDASARTQGVCGMALRVQQSSGMLGVPQGDSGSLGTAAALAVFFHGGVLRPPMCPCLVTRVCSGHPLPKQTCASLALTRAPSPLRVLASPEMLSAFFKNLGDEAISVTTSPAKGCALAFCPTTNKGKKFRA